MRTWSNYESFCYKNVTNILFVSLRMWEICQPERCELLLPPWTINHQTCLGFLRCEAKKIEKKLMVL
ncbi:hypothetical protein SAMN06273570_4611 [Candidatus Pantoea floridensis]|uniref:Uncharacterized protein n=1 Tax=Candidatus Pantoea floridensis TaxID=1938870 RepID=A0A286DNA2_9GAMM|nr:hypothetical protein BX596_4283 [Enterobacteriaceae bacterium JKS000233]SOD60178.1 hypothetical protein SAMN06273570_4611 [Pantoea floridensis]